uniref:C2H2-type domain-containing protein n=1 Tax=Meloidogyne hapla TaxID=6305 RepID=A0A1I8B231_MELHA
MVKRSKRPIKQLLPIKNKFNSTTRAKELNENVQNEKQTTNLNEHDLDALFDEAAETFEDPNRNKDVITEEDDIEAIETPIYKRPEPPSDFEKCDFDEDTYRCVYCNVNCTYFRIDRHLKTKRHQVLKQAHEEAAKNSIPKNDMPQYPINCPNDGCYTTSSLGKKYVFCIDCKRNLINLKRVLWPHLSSLTHLNAKTGAKDSNFLLKSANKHRLSTSLLKRKKSVGLVVKVAEDSSSSSSDESDEDMPSTPFTKEDVSFTRYLELKKTFKDLCYCIYCKQHFRRVRRKRHLSLQKHALMKQNFKEAEKNKNKSTEIEENETFGPTNSFVKSDKGKKFAFCIYCKADYSTKRKSNLIDHVKTTKHLFALAAVKGETTQQINDKNNEEIMDENEANNIEIEDLSDSSSGIIGRDDESDSSISLDESEGVAAKLAAYLSQKRRRRNRM